MGLLLRLSHWQKKINLMETIFGGAYRIDVPFVGLQLVHIALYYRAWYFTVYRL